MEQSARTKVITGNWKMHKTIQEAQSFLKELLPLVEESRFKICLAVPFTLIYPLVQEFGNDLVEIGAQNMNDASEGAFTGEIAGKMLVDAGAQFVLLGHSERRLIYHETNAFINRKVTRAVQVGLQPVLCVGETKDEHVNEKTEDVLREQLSECLRGLSEEELDRLVLAYEPIWAIGTGEVPSLEKIVEVHRFCRGVIEELYSTDLAEKIIIQYGGSVTPENAQIILSQDGVDGLLVGGASLSLDSFSRIINDDQKSNT